MELFSTRARLNSESTQIFDSGVIDRVKRLKSVTTNKLSLIESNFQNLNQRIRDEIERLKTSIQTEDTRITDLDTVIHHEQERHQALVARMKEAEGQIQGSAQFVTKTHSSIFLGFTVMGYILQSLI